MSVLQKLDKEDKSSLPNLEIQRRVIVKQEKKNKEKAIKVILKYDSDHYFIKGHVKEINRAFSHRCFTCVFVLFRKLVENLIIDILRVKYPESGGINNKNLYFIVPPQHSHDQHPGRWWSVNSGQVW